MSLSSAFPPSGCKFSRSYRGIPAALYLGALGATLPLPSALAQDTPPASNLRQSVTQLDTVVVSATRTQEHAVDALDNVAGVGAAELRRAQATDPGRLLEEIPGVMASPTGDDPGTVVNVRGLQEHGRVAVTIDGARQDYGRPSHAGNGTFYLEPEMLKAVTVIRGPVSGIYGSGSIGGVVSFETIDARDFLRANETWAVRGKLGYENNGKAWLGTTTGAARISDTVDLLVGTANRKRDDYQDGDGNDVLYTGLRQDSQMFKASVRPAPGHELRAGLLRYTSDYLSSRSAGSSSRTLSVDDTRTTNDSATLRYTFQPSGNPWVDLSADVYWAETQSDQSRTSDGEFREYEVRTKGMNLRNSSRFDTGKWAHTLTYGGDWYEIAGTSNHDNFGSGKSRASGVYGQWQASYNEFLHLIGALRYDNIKLHGADENQNQATLKSDRVSPRLTLALSPADWVTPYITYAEGYRAPSLAEVFRGGGHGAGTSYLPNFALRPESAETWELGANFKHDGLFTPRDRARAKLSLFHTKIDDYIDRSYIDLPDGSRYSQYQNVGEVKLKGVEVDTAYDAGMVYVRLNTSLVSVSTYNDVPLNNAPLKRISATVGARALGDKLDYGVQWVRTGSTERTLASAPRAPAYSLVNLYAGWELSPYVDLTFNVDNLLDQAYNDPQAYYATTDPSSWQGRGRTIKLGLAIRYGR